MREHKYFRRNASFGDPTRPASRLTADGNGVAALYTAYRDELVRYVWRTFGSGPPDPEDVIQAAFTHFTALARPDLVSNPRAFLYRAARNFVVDEHRRAKTRDLAVTNGDISRMQGMTNELDAVRILSARERIKIIQDGVDEMQPALRNALTLHRIEGLNYVEVARRMGISQTHAKHLVKEALAICLQKLRATDGDI